MKKSVAQGAGVAAALVMFFGSGTASANNEYKGMTYEKAAASISKYGTPVIASRVGSYLPTEKCIITGSRRGNYLDSSGKNRGGTVLLDLNCNDASALDGHPGNSVMSPEGKKDYKQHQSAEFINSNFARKTAAGEETWCQKNAETCFNFCKQTGLCSDQVKKFIGL